MTNDTEYVPGVAVYFPAHFLRFPEVCSLLLQQQFHPQIDEWFQWCWLALRKNNGSNLTKLFTTLEPQNPLILTFLYYAIGGLLRS